MLTLNLKFIENHIYIEIENNFWLLDTGSPSSFGNINHIKIKDTIFDIPSEYAGLTAAKLSQLLDTEIIGLIGTDILNNFNIILNMKTYTILFTTDEIMLSGEIFTISEFMSIPVLQVKVGNELKNMFFDTGAQLSYLPNDTIKNYPTNGIFKDFYPGLGEFETKTHIVDIQLADNKYKLCCGVAPDQVEEILTVANVDGILGNEILHNRIIGYFPLKKQLIFNKLVKNHEQNIEIKIIEPTAEILAKLNNGENSTSIILFSGYTIYKHLTLSSNTFNVVSLDIDETITIGMLDGIARNIDLKSIYICITSYGVDIFNLSKKEITPKQFLITATKVAEKLLELTQQNVLLYKSNNKSFDLGYTTD